MISDIEFYESLKLHLGEEVAKLMTERLGRTDRLATKDDIGALRTEFGELRTEFGELRTEFGELRTEFGELRTEVAEFKADMRGWMLSFFVPLWIGVYGTLAAVVISVLAR